MMQEPSQDRRPQSSCEHSRWIAFAAFDRFRRPLHDACRCTTLRTIPSLRYATMDMMTHRTLHAMTRKMGFSPDTRNETWQLDILAAKMIPLRTARSAIWYLTRHGTLRARLISRRDSCLCAAPKASRDPDAFFRLHTIPGRRLCASGPARGLIL